jgi:hypothetical protein
MQSARQAETVVPLTEVDDLERAYVQNAIVERHAPAETQARSQNASTRR